MNILEIEPRRRQGEDLVLTARLHGENATQALWFRVPAAHEADLTECADPFVLALCFRFMADARPVHVQGTVTTELLRNLEELMRMWQAWQPQRYAVVAIGAEREEDRPCSGRRRPAIQCFSGGVDSSYTAWRHHHGPAGRSILPLTAGLFLHGADIPLSRPQAYQRRLRQNHAMLASLGMRLIPVGTNVRELGIDWEHAHGAAMAGAMMLFARSFGWGLIASSMLYEWFGSANPWGSMPWTDALFSGGRMRMASDGSDGSRLDKLRRMRDWPELRRGLHVCWEGSDAAVNCGACEKCIRTQLSFHAAGMEPPPCFPRPLTVRDVLRMRLRTDLEARLMQHTLEDARRYGCGADPLFRALARVLRRHRGLGLRLLDGARACRCALTRRPR